MRSLVFREKTWFTYEQLRRQNPQLHRNLTKLIKEMLRGDLTQGTGKPEALKYNLSGCWSRRISQKDRLVYKFDDEYIYILAIGGHYDQF